MPSFQGGMQNLPKNQQNYWILRIDVIWGGIKNWQNLTFKVNFLLQKSCECFFFISISSIFQSLYFLKWCPIFDSSPLHQFSKFNNLLDIWQPVLPYSAVSIFSGVKRADYAFLNDLLTQIHFCWCFILERSFIAL